MSNAETFVMPKATITVYRMTDEVLEQVGELDEFTSLVWPKCYGDFGTFELHCPVTERNMEMVEDGNLICLGDEHAAVIEVVTATTDEQYEFEYVVRGRTLDSLLDRRIVWGVYTTDKAEKFPSTMMLELVSQNAVDPTDANRKLPYLELGEDRELGEKTSHQQTGGSLFFELQDLYETSQVWFDMLFRPKEGKIIFQPYIGSDRTYGNTEGNRPVVFDTDTEDIIKSEYYFNSQDYKNTALVGGEGEGKDRKYVSIDTGISGLLRRELSVDARDVQSESVDDDGETHTLTPEQYEKHLIDRGNKSLGENALVETYEGSVRGIGYVSYEYGVDFFVGDLVTIIDRTLGIRVDARITKVEQQFDDEYNIQITFGEAYPTIMRKVRRMVANGT